MAIDPKWLEFLREQFPQGSRIKLKELKEGPPQTENIPLGTLDHIDDDGVFHMKWENGSSLGLVLGEDRFTVLPPEPTLLKLYMPLSADLYERDDYGDLGEYGAELNSRELLEYEDSIMAAMVKNRMPEESKRGIMNWYREQDSVNDKVRSVEFTAEIRDRQLWCVAECQVVGTLSPKELDTLKEYISGQASDGWGEGFEQRPIDTADRGELYVHLWSYSHNWSIQTEQERFHPEVKGGLPDICLTTLPSTGALICIKRGEMGYSASDWETGNPEKNRQLADYYNRKRGITRAQAEAMLCGSMCGWDCPGADPKMYEKRLQEQLGGIEPAPQTGGMTLG